MSTSRPATPSSSRISLPLMATSFRSSLYRRPRCGSLPHYSAAPRRWRKPTPRRSGGSSAILWERTMITKRTIFEIHRLAHHGLSVRKIARTLGIARQSVHKYLDNPSLTRARVTRASKLDPFKDELVHLLELDPQVSAAVMHQRLQAQGFDGGM